MKHDMKYRKHCGSLKDINTFIEKLRHMINECCAKADYAICKDRVLQFIGNYGARRLWRNRARKHLNRARYLISVNDEVMKHYSSMFEIKE